MDQYVSNFKLEESSEISEEVILEGKFDDYKKSMKGHLTQMVDDAMKNYSLSKEVAKEFVSKAVSSI